MATRRTTTLAATESGAHRINNDDAFPKGKRNNTKLSVYVPDVSQMVNDGAAFHYPEFTTEEGFKSLSNQLRSVARKNHEAALEIVFYPKATPTHPAGVYARYKGPIQTRERKPVAGPAPAKAATKATKATTRKR